MKIALIVLFLLFSSLSVLAQEDSVQIIRVDSVTVSASRIPENEVRLPLSVTYQDVQPSQDMRQQLSFNEYLSNVPGLFALNANNFSQDLRVSIRGFGARSAFGIRGVKILVDGIPETTPDGQGQIDNLNLGIIKNIEIIRGPASTLYGNASGGVISINTMDKIEKDFVKAGITLGNYNMQQYQATVGLQTDQNYFIFQGNRVTTDGYRRKSGFESYNFNLRAVHQVSDFSKLNLHLNYTDSPFADDSGGLTLEELNSERQQARQRNVDFEAGETIRQFKTGMQFVYEWDDVTFNTYGFYSYRDFNGLLPFEFGGIVELDRNYFGNGAGLTFHQNFANLQNTVRFGYDFAFQIDQRLRFRNLEGLQGDKTLEQTESFTTMGIYALDHLSIGDFLIRAGIRFDRDDLKAKDLFLANGDDSGDITLNSINPSLSLSYGLSNQQYIFSSYSTSFETPALSELSANPSGEGGFNESLKAQNAHNFEVGYKLEGENRRSEVVLFYVKTDNDLVPFELEAFPDRTFFRNAGGSNRKGIELAHTQELFQSVSVRTSYTFSDFKYSSFETPSGDFEDNHLPGIPEHLASLSLAYYTETGINMQVQVNYIGALFVNDSNTINDDDYAVVNVNLGYKYSSGSLVVAPFVGVNNVFDTKYNDNIRINAFGGRYYEPAPAVNIFGGVRMTL